MGILLPTNQLIFFGVGSSSKRSFQDERPEGGFAHAAPPISRHGAGGLQGSCSTTKACAMWEILMGINKDCIIFTIDVKH